MNIIDSISASVGILYIIPIFLYINTGNSIHFTAFLGTAGTTLLSETLKYMFIGKVSPRPLGAKDCNLLCNDGNQACRPGMPSSHSAEVAFFSGFYYQYTNNIYIKGLLIFYALAVMLSRYIKRCHTINQIIIGAMLGGGISWIVVRHL